jgi:hypothetical protein
VKEHKASLKKWDPDISKLTEHSINMGHRFTFDETKVIGMEANWRQRKIHEAGEILKGGENKISTPSFKIDAIWRLLIKETRVRGYAHAPLRRSDRLREKAGQVNEAPKRVLRQRRVVGL